MLIGLDYRAADPDVNKNLYAKIGMRVRPFVSLSFALFSTDRGSVTEFSFILCSITFWRERENRYKKSRGLSLSTHTDTYVYSIRLFRRRV